MTEMGEHPQLTQAREFAHQMRELSRRSPDKVGLAVHVNGAPELTLLSSRAMRVRSMSKTAIGLAYAREVANDPSFAKKTVKLAEIDRVGPGYFDGGAHANWKASLAEGEEVSHAAIARGMLQDSSNTCTQFMLDVLGHDKVNAIATEHGVGLEFRHMYDEVHHPMRASTTDMAKLMDGIAIKESPAVQSVFAEVTLPFQVRSVAHGDGLGFGKGGSASNMLGHDLNYSWHVHAQGKPVSAAFMTNGLDAATLRYMEERMPAFACEASCNEGFRQECATMFRRGAAILAHGGEILGKTGRIHL